ncbi:hypothetical protein [Ferruginibacter sp. HRS2-29]|uniref:hypothetical protein n=1 Tax=Ferruginibacter sp. HRS2-29 TaxID=2487334 RepID=UPI0020CC2AA6|nr:hypothetical protein [Ferruginibacter sp. HRS2-29]MCP9750566.1 hypothetical protein [Ferruginibacter sp. HRS2-29]
MNKNKIFSGMKALTPAMLEMMMDCHERELQTLEPCDTYKTQSAKGLIQRGLFTSRMYTSPTTKRTYMAFYVTQKGKEYLEWYTRK